MLSDSHVVAGRRHASRWRRAAYHVRPTCQCQCQCVCGRRHAHTWRRCGGARIPNATLSGCQAVRTDTVRRWLIPRLQCVMLTRLDVRSTHSKMAPRWPATEATVPRCQADPLRDGIVSGRPFRYDRLTHSKMALCQGDPLQDGIVSALARGPSGFRTPNARGGALRNATRAARRRLRVPGGGVACRGGVQKSRKKK